MRTVEVERIINTDVEDGGDLLTTGEAAALLGCTRQHVGNLIKRGDVPASRVGAHYRLRRSDVEALRRSSWRPTRDQRRSLWLGYAIAGKIVSDPVVALEVARGNIETMLSTQRGAGRRWLLRWADLLDGPIEPVLEALTSNSTVARELRQNNPFAGLLDEDTRLQVLAATRHQQ